MIEVLSALNITKKFPGVLALDHVNFKCLQGEIHALIGENGAGKSTLMKILAGAYTPDEGELFIKGKKVDTFNPRISQEAGIGIIYQELSLLPYLNVTENIFLGREILNSHKLIDFGEMEKQANKILSQLNCNFHPRIPVYQLNPAQRQLVEIAKALSFNPDILIMDEPTSSLVDNEIQQLFSIIHSLKDRGVTIIYISHRLEEVFEIADRVTVLKDGKKVKTLSIEQANEKQLIHLMVGRDLKENNFHEKHISEDIVLQVNHLSQKGVLEDINLKLHKGEILGIAGLIGSGRTELARAIFAADKYDSGSILINGKPLKNKSPREVIDQGIALIPEDRKNDGLILIHTVQENIALPSLKKREAFGFIKMNVEKSIVQHSIEELSISTPSIKQEVNYLSGGNQQKIVLAKWLDTGADVFIFDEPTRGIDVASKAEIHRHIKELAQKGKSIIMISSELPEILSLSDRILVISGGTVAGELSKAEANEESVLELAYSKVKHTLQGDTTSKNTSQPLASHDTVYQKFVTEIHKTNIGNNLVFIFLIALTLLGAFGSDRFLTSHNLTNILRQSVTPMLLGIGQTLVILSGGIDFSVSSIVTITNVLAAGLMMGNNRLLFPITVLSLGLGLAIGAINAFIILKLKVPPIITTLGTMIILQGAALIYTRVPIGVIPSGLSYLAFGNIGPLPASTYLELFILTLGFLLLYRKPYGRHLYATGGDENIAKLSGISINRVKVIAYTISGFLAALTGLYLASRMGSGDPSVGPGLEFDSLATVLLGGTVLGGGRGGLLGTVAGVLVLVVLSNVFNQVGINVYFQQITKGLIIIIAVTLFHKRD